MKLAENIKRIDIFYVLTVVYVLWLISLKNRHTGGMDDFDIFFKAGERLVKGENIYGAPHYYNLKYFYSVFFAGIMALCQWMDINTAKMCWFIINTGLLVRTLFLMRDYILGASSRPGLTYFLLLLLSGKIVLVNYTFGQASPLILWTMVEATHQVIKGRTLIGVLILCLGINIKIMPLALAPYLVVIGKKPLQVVIYGLLFSCAFLLLPAVFIGWSYNNMLLAEWWQTLNPVSEIHIVQTYENGFMDLSAMVTKFFSAKPVYNEPQLNIASLPRDLLFAITNVLRATLLGLSVYLMLNLKRPLAGIDQRFIVAAAFMALVPLCFPHQRVYSYMLCMPQLAILMILVAYSRKTAYLVSFIFLILLSGVMVWIDYAGPVITDMITHCRLLTMGMLGIFVLYVLVCLNLASRQET